MTNRIAVALLALAALAGCKSPDRTHEELPSDPAGQTSGVVEHELYWHQRGSDATKAIWSKFRVSNGVSLIGEENGVAPSFGFAVESFNLLLDSVSSFWRTDLASEAVSAYFHDFAAVYPDRSAYAGNYELLRWAIACIRASRVTGNRLYLEEGRSLYDAVWLGQVDNALDGGMWGRCDVKSEKSAAANLCAVVAAISLYYSTQDVKYLLQARRLYKWTVQRLVDPSTGMVYAWIAADGSRAKSMLAGDAGVFISASMRLYRATGSGVYLANAKKTADLLIADLGDSSAKACVVEGDSLSRGIAMRCLSELARRPGCEKYREYILSNARSAWTSRRLSDGLNGSDWSKTPDVGDVVAPRHAVAAAVLYFSASRACR